jgi:excisionase family DNA binding protein
MQKEFEIIAQRLSRIEKALSLNSEDKFVTSDEFCQMTGMSKNTFYQTRTKIPITPYYFGRKLRFKREEVINWLESTLSSEPFSLGGNKTD